MMRRRDRLCDRVGHLKLLWSMLGGIMSPSHQSVGTKNILYVHRSGRRVFREFTGDNCTLGESETGRITKWTRGGLDRQANSTRSRRVFVEFDRHETPNVLPRTPV